MFKKVGYLLAIIALIIAITPLTVDAESASFGVLNYDLNIETDFNVKINVQDLVEVGTVEFFLEYDTSLITYLNTSSGDLMAANLGILESVSLDGDMERLSIAIASSDISVSGSGELAHLYFKSNSKRSIIASLLWN